MKNKGYTLLELLGVIVILSVLITLVFPSIINFIKKGNETKESITNELIISAAEHYINDNSADLYLNSGTEYCVSINTLIETQYLNIEIDDNLYSSKSVKVTYNNKTNYEIIDSKDCSVCKLVSGEPNEIGSKYQCKVKDNMEIGFEDGYYFFVLGTNSDGTTNLIMERNMYYDRTNDVGLVATSSNSNVAWYASTDSHSYGPVTAMNYLHSATKDWDNIPNMIMNYEDENIDSNTQQKGTNGYGGIVTTNNITIITSKNNEETARIENLKARMPRYDEVHGENKCLTYAENGNEYGSCPLWLSNYLSSSSYVTGDGLQNISLIYGYWTLSSSASKSDDAWVVDDFGYVDIHYVDLGSGSGVDFDDWSFGPMYGVRPVITVKNVIELN